MTPITSMLEGASAHDVYETLRPMLGRRARYLDTVGTICGVKLDDGRVGEVLFHWKIRPAASGSVWMPAADVELIDEED